MEKEIEEMRKEEGRREEETEEEEDSDTVEHEFNKYKGQLISSTSSEVNVVFFRFARRRDSSFGAFLAGGKRGKRQTFRPAKNTCQVR